MPLYAKSRALVIGIDAYQDPANRPLTFASGARFDNLCNAVNDASAVAALLRDEFDFDEVVELYDAQATRTNIEAHLRDVLHANAEPEDRLVIFFAGHGHTQKATHTPAVGHLLTYGAQNFSQAISMDDLRNWFRTIPAKHILLLLDCCFSGSVAFTESFSARRLWEGGGYLERLTGKTSWQVLTAGGADEPVADSSTKPGHSVFTAALLEGLAGAADENFDGVITFEALADRVKRQVVEATSRSGYGQEPIFKDLLNGDAGSNVFLTRRRRLQDQLGRALIEAIQQSALPLPLFFSTFASICQDRGREPLLVDRSPAACLSELWSWGETENAHSPILLFAQELARRHPAIARHCKAWRQQALAEPHLGLHWPETLPPALAAGEDSGEVPVLTVSLDPVDLSPDTPPERNVYKVNIYYWQTQRPVGDEKLCSLREAKAEVDRVLRAISYKYPAQATKLAVEFCLPLALLSSALEEWPKRKDTMGSVALGVDHPVAVRSIDGLKSISRRPYWQQKWESFKASRHVHPHPIAGAICRGHEYQPGSIYNHYHQSAVHCLALTDTPPIQLNRRTPLAELLEAGIPIAIWPRQAALNPPAEESVHQALHTLLHSGALDSLPVRVQRARRDAGEEDISRHLTLLWDDYDRIPPQYRALEEEAFDDLNL